jgi:AcrR family transcriptional regulator
MTDSQDFTGTRADLIRAALHLFGRSGYGGTSTRAIADRAGTNVASIAYHFGGKPGLHLACADFVGQHVSRAFSSLDAAPLPASPAAARAEMHAAIRTFAMLVIGTQEANDLVSFVTRELSDPGEVARRLFDTVLLPRHAQFCALWSIATGQPADSEEVKLSVFALIGQVIYFRLAQPFVVSRMGWPAMGPDQVDRILALLRRNLDDSLERNRT